MRGPVLRPHDDELIVDNFAGGGGASSGIERALGRAPDIAINHSALALAMHEANHPTTVHVQSDVWEVDPVAVCAGRPVGLAWFSPDCTHHSKAKGGKPRERKGASKSRALAWVVVRWARAVRPRVIMLENVEEFADWGPLARDGRPDKLRKGLTFRIWLGKLRAAGYDVEMRELRACDYGAPTSRKRLFVIARRDGRPIVWPEPTHGPGRARPYRTAAECIDWDIPCRSIFGRTKPLAEKTLRRIARGVMRYVVDAATPFIIPLTHGRVNDSRLHSVDEPVRTITGANRGELALVAPTLVQTGYGERPGQTPRALDIQKPLGTSVPGGKHALVAAFLAKHFGGHESPGLALSDPASTITTQDHHAIVTSHMLKLRGTCADGQRIDAPAPTLTASGTHLAEVRSFLCRYNGIAHGQPVQLPLGTITTARRFGLVYVHGEPYAIADIGMRMLEPRELFRAQAFADDYVIDPVVEVTLRGHLKRRPLTKTEQIKMCGNSVPPVMSQALVAANFGEAAHRGLVA